MMKVDNFVYKLVLRQNTSAAPENVMAQLCAHILSDKWGRGTPIPWAKDIARRVLESDGSADLDNQHLSEL